VTDEQIEAMIEKAAAAGARTALREVGLLSLTKHIGYACNAP
jgi:hypothetical protein